MSQLATPCPLKGVQALPYTVAMIASLAAGLLLTGVPSLHLDPYLVGRGSHHAMDLAVTRLTKDHIRAGIEENRYTEPALTVNGQGDAKRAVVILRRVHIKGLTLFDPPTKQHPLSPAHVDQSSLAPDVYRIGKGSQTVQAKVNEILIKAGVNVWIVSQSKRDVLTIGRADAVRAISILRPLHVKDLTLLTKPEKIFYDRKSFSTGPADDK